MFSRSSTTLFHTFRIPLRPPAHKTIHIRPLTTMKALTYTGANNPPQLKDVPTPTPTHPTDAIIKVKHTTICGTDLHILKGDVPTITPGRILGHEGVGTITATGPGVTRFTSGDAVLISCISSCGTCRSCKRGMNSHCDTGGWILGNTIDGTQAEYVRVPHADNSLYKVPDTVDSKAVVMLSDIFPTGFECGVLNAGVAPGSSVVIVGAGPVGLAALLTAQFYAVSRIIVVDFDGNRLDVARGFGATDTASPDEAKECVMRVTGGKGCDAVIEAVGVEASFLLCQELLAAGGRLANVGVHGGSVGLRLDLLWDRNVAITTRLVDGCTTPQLLDLLAAKKLPAEKLITHEFGFHDMVRAYEVFGRAAQEKALKVLINMD